MNFMNLQLRQLLTFCLLMTSVLAEANPTSELRKSRALSLVTQNKNVQSLIRATNSLAGLGKSTKCQSELTEFDLVEQVATISVSTTCRQGSSAVVTVIQGAVQSERFEFSRIEVVRAE